MKSRNSNPRRSCSAFTLIVCVGFLALGMGSGATEQLPAPAPVLAPAALTMGLSLGGQQAASQDRPQFEAAVDMVLIDCVVLDGDETSCRA